MARQAGAEIFATASRGKWEVLRRDLGLEHTFDSRSLDFADQLRERTGGDGVDVVLNTLGAAATRESLRLVRSGGTFVELGKRGVLGVGEAACVSGELAYESLDLSVLCRTDPAGVQV